MKKAIVVALMLVTTNVFADNDDPRAWFSTNKNMTTQSTVTWRAVENVQAECNKESKRLAGQSFGYAVLACSFWEKQNGRDVCTIITGKNTTMHSLGHEMRHCFQGNWHD
jgi:hypothetical protein